jgi:hypothetical protein
LNVAVSRWLPQMSTVRHSFGMCATLRNSSHSGPATFDNFIDGEWVPSVSSATFENRNLPGTTTSYITRNGHRRGPRGWRVLGVAVGLRRRHGKLPPVHTDAADLQPNVTAQKTTRGGRYGVDMAMWPWLC